MNLGVIPLVVASQIFEENWNKYVVSIFKSKTRGGSSSDDLHPAQVHFIIEEPMLILEVC